MSFDFEKRLKEIPGLPVLLDTDNATLAEFGSTGTLEVSKCYYKTDNARKLAHFILDTLGDE